MRIKTLLLAAFSLCLASCDLSEAQRMDISRSSIRGISADLHGVTFFGRQDVSIDSLISLSPGILPFQVWKIVAGDSGSPKFNGWVVRGWWRDSLVFSASYNSNWLQAPIAGSWMLHPDELRMEVVLTNTYINSSGYYYDTDTLLKKWVSSPGFLQDFNELHWDTTFAKKSIRNGDTLRLKVGVDRGSPGKSDSMPVFADYNGLRTVGDYVRYLKANDTATLTWVVTGAPGDSIRLSLDWGKFGESHGFGFRVAR